MFHYSLLPHLKNKIESYQSETLAKTSNILHSTYILNIFINLTEKHLFLSMQCRDQTKYVKTRYNTILSKTCSQVVLEPFHLYQRRWQHQLDASEHCLTFKTPMFGITPLFGISPVSHVQILILLLSGSQEYRVCPKRLENRSNVRLFRSTIVTVPFTVSHKSRTSVHSNQQSDGTQSAYFDTSQYSIGVHMSVITCSTCP